MPLEPQPHSRAVMTTLELRGEKTSNSTQGFVEETGRLAADAAGPGSE
jgi:hypothetical protein